MQNPSATHRAIRTATPALTPVFVLGVAALCALLLALPGQTVTTKYVNDLFIHLDGAYRVLAGQAPNRDFHTPLGSLTYYVPAAGYWLSGSFGATMPTAMALLTLGFAPVLAYVLHSRLRPAIALPFAAFLLLILAVPLNLGEGVTALTFAKFYDRVGWAALATLLVMYLRPEPARPRQDGSDAAAAAVLTLLLIYTKATYGLAALMFLAFVLTDPRQRRWAALALALVALAGFAAETVWRSSAAHLADLLLTARVSGGVRGTWGQNLDQALGSLADYVLLAILAGLALRRTRSLRDALFYLFCTVSGFLLVRQNFQLWGMISLHAAAAVAAETVLRRMDDVPESAPRDWSVPAGVKLLFLALVLPTIVHGALALSLHAGLAGLRAGEPIAVAPFDRIRLANLWNAEEYEVAARYGAALRDGMTALSGLDPKPDRIAALDPANPFSAALGARPPRGDASWLLPGRTFDAAHFVPPEDLLAGARIVMQPRPDNPGSLIVDEGHQIFQRLYGSTLAARFEPVRETAYWVVHRRRAPDTQAACGDDCGAPAAPVPAGTDQR